MTPLDLLNLTDNALLALHEGVEDEVKRDRATLEMVQTEIRRRMEMRGATGIPDATYDCVLTVANQYDAGQLTPLLELLQEADLEKCYIPAHQETVDVEARWDLRKLPSIAKRYGTDALRIVEKARFPGRSTLTVKRKEKV